MAKLGLLQNGKVIVSHRGKVHYVASKQIGLELTRAFNGKRDDCNVSQLIQCLAIDCANGHSFLSAWKRFDDNATIDGFRVDELPLSLKTSILSQVRRLCGKSRNLFIGV